MNPHHKKAVEKVGKYVAAGRRGSWAALQQQIIELITSQ